MYFRTKDAAAFLLLAVLVVGSHFNVPAPKPIKVQEVTETQIREGVKNEIREKEIRRAVVAARKVYRRNGCGDRFSDLTGRTAYEYGLSSRLLAAVVFVESSCRPTAISGRDSYGLMQVNKLVWKHTRSELMNPETNMRIGAQILRSYISRYGVVEGLHHYNGLGVKTNEYAEKVLAAGGIKI